MTSKDRFAYHFQKLRVDLGRSVAHALPIAEEMIRDSIGGCGLGVRLLLETESAELDAFNSQGSLLFVFSPLVGSPVTTSAKFAVVSKSPLTGRINDSLAGSGFAIAGKKTGFDVIELTGRAPQPVVVIIDNGKVRFEPANDLWGETIPETERLLKSRFGAAYRIACIGPAGENRVLYATISHDGRHAGRGGSGAILGSKNVKALLVKGNRKVEWFQPENLNQLSKQLSRKSFGPATAKYRELGTATNLLAFNRLQCLPTRNFGESSFEAAEQLAPESLSETRERVRNSCAACTIGCEHLYSVGGLDSTQDPKVRLEYESLFALGPLCGISDPEIVLQASKVCDELGLDTISAGGSIAFMMECEKRGLVETTLRFGDGNGMLEMLPKIARRFEQGATIAEGSRRLAERIGQGSIAFAPQIKGLEIPGYDPRKLTTMALGFSVGTRGADHNKSSAYEYDFSAQGKPENGEVFSDKQIAKAIELEDKAAVMDSLILCKFLRNIFDNFFQETAELISMATGWSLNQENLRMIGSNIIQTKKQFNIRSGWTPEEDGLPEMFFGNSSETGQAIYSREELQSAIESYNLKRGWTKEGFPSKSMAR